MPTTCLSTVTRHSRRVSSWWIARGQIRRSWPIRSATISMTNEWPVPTSPWTQLRFTTARVSESEWEYAARAGSRTAFYSGEHTKNPDPLERTSYDDKNLSPIAWYNWNSGNRTHPVMQKLPNAWGLYDVLGNITEWTYSSRTTDDFTGPMVDPVRPPRSPSDTVTGKGGLANGVPGMLRAAARTEFEPMALGIGFRLVRTLRQGEVWPPGKTK